MFDAAARSTIASSVAIDENCHGGGYTVDEVALRHGAGAEEETSDADLAYARFPETQPTRYRDGWLPDG